MHDGILCRPCLAHSSDELKNRLRVSKPTLLNWVGDEFATIISSPHVARNTDYASYTAH